MSQRELDELIEDLDNINLISNSSTVESQKFLVEVLQESKVICDEALKKNETERKDFKALDKNAFQIWNSCFEKSKKNGQEYRDELNRAASEKASEKRRDKLAANVDQDFADMIQDQKSRSRAVKKKKLTGAWKKQFSESTSGHQPSMKQVLDAMKERKKIAELERKKLAIEEKLKQKSIDTKANSVLKRKKSEDSNSKAKKKAKLDDNSKKPASKARKKQAKKKKKNPPKQKTLLNFFKKKSSS
jgi:hypothetical protein